MRTLIPLLSLLVIGVACRQAPAPEAIPEATPVRVTVGQHELALSVPDGCHRFDHGREQRFRCSGAQLSLKDSGPATTEGYRREIQNARRLFRKGQVDDARSYLRGLTLKAAFDERQWREVSADWDLVLGLGRHRSAPSHEIDSACARIGHRVGSLKDPALLDIVQRIMPEIDRSTHREIGRSESLIIDERAGVFLQTWDKMTHDHRKSFLFVLNNDNLLVLGMGMGAFDEMEGPFKALAASLVIHPTNHSLDSALR